MTAISRQEMFNRAFIGLASQGFTRCMSGGDCVYLADDGRRCAWGWVDASLGAGDNGDVGNLRDQGIGIAAKLDDDDLLFAMELQATHDESTNTALQEDLRLFAARKHLTVPVLP